METRFELRFYDGVHDGDPILTQLTSSVNEVAISYNKMYIRFNDMYYDDLTTADILSYESFNINKIELVIYDRMGNITDTQVFKGKIVDIADFSYGYNTQSRFDKILLVFEFKK